MSGITSPAIYIIESGEILPDFANKFADEALIEEGINPLEAFYDSEIQRHHRALAIQANESFKSYIRKCLIMEGED